MFMFGGGTYEPVVNNTANIVDSSTSSPVTLSGVSIGSASADRLVVVLLNWRGLPGMVLTGVTIGGVAATEVAAANYAANGDGVGIYTRVVSSGSTCDIVISSSTAAPTGLYCHVYAIYGLNSTAALDSAADIEETGLFTVPVTMDYHQNGVVLFTGYTTTGIASSLQYFALEGVSLATAAPSRGEVYREEYEDATGDPNLLTAKWFPKASGASANFTYLADYTSLKYFAVASWR